MLNLINQKNKKLIGNRILIIPQIKQKMLPLTQPNT